MAMNETTSGAVAGASAGAMFGPVGMAVGAVIGFFGGRSQKRKRQQMEVAATRSSYGYAQEAYSFASKGQEQLSKTYASKFASARAQQAGSGASLEGSRWESVQGGLIRERDEAQSSLDLKRDEFRATESYGLFQTDYTRMASSRISKSKAHGNRGDIERGGSYGGSADVRGLAGESFYTSEQRSKLQGYSGGSTRDPYGESAWSEYVSMTKPTLGEWETGRFGSEEQKLEYSTMIDERIDKANIWYDRKKTEMQVTTANQNRFYDSDRGRR